jgi:hypothetical protein
MVANWSHLFPPGFGKAGVMAVIKGHIWAIPDLCGHIVFSSQGQGSKDGARGSPQDRMIYPSTVNPFAWLPVAARLAAANFPVT